MTMRFHPQTVSMKSINRTILNLPQRSENLQGTVAEITKMADRFKISPDALPVYPINLFTRDSKEKVATTENGVELKTQLTKALEVFEDENTAAGAKIRTLERKGYFSMGTAIALAACGVVIMSITDRSAIDGFTDANKIMKHAIGLYSASAALFGAAALAGYKFVRLFKAADAVRSEILQIERFFNKVKGLIDESREQFIAAASGFDLNSRDQLPRDL